MESNSNQPNEVIRFRDIKPGTIEIDDEEEDNSSRFPYPLKHDTLTRTNSDDIIAVTGKFDCRIEIL